eukprot:3718263-Prymnesium_polylepis.3
MTSPRSRTHTIAIYTLASNRRFLVGGARALAVVETVCLLGPGWQAWKHKQHLIVGIGRVDDMSIDVTAKVAYDKRPCARAHLWTRNTGLLGRTVRPGVLQSCPESTQRFAPSGRWLVLRNHAARQSPGPTQRWWLVIRRQPASATRTLQAAAQRPGSPSPMCCRDWTCRAGAAGAPQPHLDCDAAFRQLCAPSRTSDRFVRNTLRKPQTQ